MFAYLFIFLIPPKIDAWAEIMKMFLLSFWKIEAKNWYSLTKFVLTYCSSDREKLLKFKAEGREFANFLRSLEQFIEAVKGQSNFC